MQRRFLVLTVIALAAGQVGHAAGSLRITPVVRGQNVVVSVELADGYTQEVRQAIASGLRTSITYELELRLDVPVWADRTVASVEVMASDQYDNLTRRHSLVRTVDGRVEDALVTEDEALARRWLISLSALPLCKVSKLDRQRDYYVRISARVRPLGGSLLGLTNAITSQAKFTFLP